MVTSRRFLLGQLWDLVHGFLLEFIQAKYFTFFLFLEMIQEFFELFGYEFNYMLSVQTFTKYFPTYLSSFLSTCIFCMQKELYCVRFQIRQLPLQVGRLVDLPTLTLTKDTFQFLAVTSSVKLIIS